MLHAGLDLSRRRVDVCLLDRHGRLVAETAARPDANGLRGLAARFESRRVRAVIESMNGARFVHDTLEELGWDVLVADAHKVKGLAPLACKTDKIDAQLLAVLSQRDLVPAIWLPRGGAQPEASPWVGVELAVASGGAPVIEAGGPSPRPRKHVEAPTFACGRAWVKAATKPWGSPARL